MADITYIPIRQLYPHPDNPRKELGDLSELAASIKENGVYQNLTVIPGHSLLKGARHHEHRNRIRLSQRPYGQHRVYHRV